MYHRLLLPSPSYTLSRSPAHESRSRCCGLGYVNTKMNGHLLLASTFTRNSLPCSVSENMVSSSRYSRTLARSISMVIWCSIQDQPAKTMGTLVRGWGRRDSSISLIKHRLNRCSSARCLTCRCSSSASASSRSCSLRRPSSLTSVSKRSSMALVGG